MEALRAVYEALNLEEPRTHVQSGNVIFRTNEKNSPALSKKIEKVIEREFGCRPEVILRTTNELRNAVSASPFASGRNLEPGKILVTFLASEPVPDAHTTLFKFKSHPEEIHLKGRELYIYFPDGAGRSKLPWSSIAKLLKTTGTARNWNSVTKMLAIAEELEGKESCGPKQGKTAAVLSKPKRRSKD